MNRAKHAGLSFQLERVFDAKVRVVSRVDASNSVIVVVDLPELPTDAERIVKKVFPSWLSFSVWTYQHLRAIASDPNSRIADLLTAAHVLPRSVQTNAMYELIALEDAVVAQRLQDLAG
ncbi:MAG: hypothetical protein HC933_16035 [Pleurocapsa sp. SU_196_0]|nr:hypothetical protein [Pleurocapsa sp. SU_196_0]